ncbi:monovalent cation/H(+) antiporter subunit G [Anaerotalea alkaliphila]|uniref:Monovalent cation/H(+) antiporter subunit G n=1 Tax=Anaerotalea alkaliphila TaxID=2662126 RepID=A0A7X5KMX3_9FIRM|nr:monovalent cation/H(+) antiporter subunit G [Anaerotalea alkaliphila]NDL67424.1 monovalent cation/H(+) antiporter subunit G [Anaerotalea alkaliphila]
MWDHVGNAIIVLGIVFVGFGVFGIYRFNDFYARILIASKVDTVGFMTIMLGVVVRQGFSYFTWKVLLVLVVMLVTNPLATHSIARSAHYSGYRVRKGG